MNGLWFYFVAVVFFNLAMFLPAYIYKTDKLTDISYALSFIVLTLLAYARSTQTLAHIILTLLVVWWALRLGSFLLYRVTKKGKDKRFDVMRGSAVKFVRFWLLQGITVFVVLVGVLLFLQIRSPKLGLLSYLGVVIFIAGLFIEAIADLQKWQFSEKKVNKGKWIDEGLWARSRHPNYLGEMLVWVGLYVYVLPSLVGVNVWWAVVSPIYIISLLLFASGIPLLEKSADAKWGDIKDYKDYKKRVPKLLPKLW